MIANIIVSKEYSIPNTLQYEEEGPTYPIWSNLFILVQPIN